MILYDIYKTTEYNEHLEKSKFRTVCYTTKSLSSGWQNSDENLKKWRRNFGLKWRFCRTINATLDNKFVSSCPQRQTRWSMFLWTWTTVFGVVDKTKQIYCPKWHLSACTCCTLLKLKFALFSQDNIFDNFRKHNPSMCWPSRSRKIIAMASVIATCMDWNAATDRCWPLTDGVTDGVIAFKRL